MSIIDDKIILLIIGIFSLFVAYFSYFLNSYIEKNIALTKIYNAMLDNEELDFLTKIIDLKIQNEALKILSTKDDVLLNYEKNKTYIKHICNNILLGLDENQKNIISKYSLDFSYYIEIKVKNIIYNL